MSGSGPVLVVGLAATGEAVVRRLRAEGRAVAVIDDDPQGERYEARAAAMGALGADVIGRLAGSDLVRRAEEASMVVPSPLVDERHPAVVAARAAGVPVRAEIDLAYERARRPIVAVTGTNGKTTVTTLVAAMLEASGRRAAAAGNIGRTLLEAVDDDVDVLVAEVSSFQLAFCDAFRPRVAVLLAVAEDHLDWHGSVDAYVEAKARIFARQAGDDLLVYDADDPTAARLAVRAPARRVAVSLDPGARSAFHPRGGHLLAPDGEIVASRSDLTRRLPHDLTNALAASAAALAAGASLRGVRTALRRVATLPHRVTLVGDAGGVRWYDDSKATNPHAVVHAVRGFDSVVLLAGGRNKGLDLAALTRAGEHLRGVVAFGEAGPVIAAAFAGLRPVETVRSVRDAVRAAALIAEPGDVVLLSPGCASFDAYPGYAARGDDFAAAVAELLAEDPAERVP